MENFTPSLCMPDDRKSCFACCPPIRPPGYEHEKFRSFLHKEFIRVFQEFSAKELSVRPITGFSCWALGYLDSKFRQAGCLLHPCLHSGRDLRYHVDFGSKCAREMCVAARTFERLDMDVKQSLLHIADGLDSFTYSSFSRNPLFTLMHWGSELLTLFARSLPAPVMERERFLNEFPLFAARLDPRPHAYCVTRVISLGGVDAVRDSAIFSLYSRVFEQIVERYDVPLSRQANRPHVHTVHEDRLYVAFMRHALGIRKITPSEAATLKILVDKEIDRFCERVRKNTI